MSHTRYYVSAGATTTSGGTVHASSTLSLSTGAALAREGDPVDCPACGAQGFIRCTGARLSDSFEGRQYALSGDLCICDCSTPPELIAKQRDEFQLLGSAM